MIRSSFFVAFIALMGLCDSVWAGLMYQSGFETPPYSLGPIDGQDGWVASTTEPFRSHEVVSGVSQDGTQSLRVTLALSPEMPVPGAAVEHAVQGGQLGSITVGLRLSTAWLSAPANISGAGFSSDWGSMSLGRDPSGQWFWNLGGGSSTGGSVPAVVAADTWYTLRLENNLLNTTFFVNGSPIGNLLPSYATLSGISLLANRASVFPVTSSSSVYFDNVIVDAIPEPASLALLAGIAALPQRRRR